MSTTVVVLLIVGAVVILGVGAEIAIAIVVLARMKQDRQAAFNGGYEQRGGYPSSTQSPSALPGVDGEPGPGSKVEEVAQPVPYDPDNPPVWKTYTPRPGAAERLCNCHDELLTYGQRVMWWPQPDGSVLLFCERAARVGT